MSGKRLGYRCPLHTAGTEIVTSPIQVAEVPKKFLDPEASTFAHGGQLGGLVVSETSIGSDSYVISKVVRRDIEIVRALLSDENEVSIARCETL